MKNKSNELLQESFLPPLNKFSFSKIYTFQRCPFEYKYMHIEPTGNRYYRKSSQISCGNILHFTLKDFFNKKTNKYRSLNNLQDLLNKNWKSSEFDDKLTEEKWYKISKDILNKFFSNTITFANPIGVENKFKVVVDDIILTGIIDRIDYSEKGYVIFDYKLEDYMNDSDQDLQPIFYYFGAKSLLKVPPIKLVYLYLMDSYDKSIYFEEPMITKGLAVLKDIIKEIENTKIFIPRRNSLCYACGVKQICPDYTI